MIFLLILVANIVIKFFVFENHIKKMNKLIEMSDIAGLKIDLAYMRADNFVGRPVYADSARAALRPEAKACLEKAAAAAIDCGLTLIVYDAYRPAAVQDIFWAAISDPRYVADASQGSNHTRGTAIDVSLMDENGVLLDMGTAFDTMSEQAHHGYQGFSHTINRNRNLLLGIMMHAGFTTIPTEWWHYELPDSDKYELIPESEFVTIIN